MDIHESILDCIRRADRAGAKALLVDWAAVHGSTQLLTEVLEPSLKRIGDDWSTQEAFTIAQAYVAAKITEDVLNMMAGNLPSGEVTSAGLGPVVIGNIEEDFHALGRRMVTTFLRASGWIVHDLGNDVPASEFVDQAIATGSRVIGVSAMMLSTARNIRRVRDEIDRRGLTDQIKLAVGGAIFVVRPGLVAEVGGDGTAANAIGSALLFKQLWASASIPARAP